jgi:hypothetical protein
MSKDDLDHTFRIEELRGMSQYRRTLLLHALLMLREFGCCTLASASDGSIHTLPQCPDGIEILGRSYDHVVLHVKESMRRVVPVGRHG